MYLPVTPDGDSGVLWGVTTVSLRSEIGGLKASKLPLPIYKVFAGRTFSLYSEFLIHRQFLPSEASKRRGLPIMSSKLTPPNPDEVMVIRNITPNVATFSVPFARFGKLKVGGRGTLGKYIISGKIDGN